MLALAAKFEGLLREAGIDPELVTDINIVKNNSSLIGKLEVKIQPRTEYIDITIVKTPCE